MVVFFLFKTKSLELCLMHRRKKVSSPPHLYSAFPVSQHHFSFLITEGYSHFLSSSFCICHCSEELSLWLLWLFGDPHDCISSQTIQLPVFPTSHGFCFYRSTNLPSEMFERSGMMAPWAMCLLCRQAKPKFKPLEYMYKKSGACNPRAGTVETRESLKFAGH